MSTARKSRPLLRQHLRPLSGHAPRPAPLPSALAAIGFCTLLFSSPMAVQAQQLPAGGNVVSGSASIHNTSATQQLITQGSNKAIINWQGFSIGQGNSVQFVQPGASSVVLNRVIGNDPSAIFGSLSANGQVFLVNPQGIYFSPSASLNVAGLIASTLNIRDDDFLAGRYSFTRDPNSPATASVINEGLIRAREGGYVVLAGDYVANRGIVEARLGTVALAAGSKVTLDLQGDSLINLAVNEKTVAELAGVANSGALNAEGGRVVMTAAVARDLAGTVVNNSGVVRANGTVSKDGAIYLVGDGGDVSSSGSLNVSGTRGGNVTVQSTGTTLVSGSVDATGSAGKGGTVQVLGQYAGLTGNANIDASGSTGGGTVLVGGDYQGKNSAVQNAQRSYVGADAVIKADATQSGDGGKVIVWADDVTRYHGTISARGGVQGGNGGFAEVSGKQYLGFDGRVDLTAPQGANGSLLLDPTNIVIQAAAGANDATLLGDSQVLFAEGGVTESIGATALQNLTGNITLQAEQNITLNNSVNLALTNQTAGERVAFQAGGNITLGGVITTAGASVLMSAGDAGAAAPAATAGVTVNGTGGIASGGGDITLQSTGTGGIALAGNLTAGAGTVRLVTTNGGISQTTGAITGNALGVRSSGTVAFRNETNVAHNDVAVFAAQVTGSGNALEYTNIQEPGDVNIGTVAADALPGSLFGGALSGVSTNNANLTVTSRGQMTVLAGANVAAGTGIATLRTLDNTAGIADLTINANVSGNKVIIDSADGISQEASSSITSPQLLVLAAAGSADDSVTLTGTNNIGTLSAAKSSTFAGTGGITSFTFNNGANALTVGTVDTISGITAIPTSPATGSVALTAGSLAITQSITTGSGSGVVALQPNSGTNASLGGAAAFDLTQAELNLVTTGSLSVGNVAGAGALSVDSAIANGPNWTTLILRSGSGGARPRRSTSLASVSNPPAMWC